MMKAVKPVNKKIRGLVSLIGNTPLFEIEFIYRGKKRAIYLWGRSGEANPGSYQDV